MNEDWKVRKVEDNNFDWKKKRNAEKKGSNCCDSWRGGSKSALWCKLPSTRSFFYLSPFPPLSGFPREFERSVSLRPWGGDKKKGKGEESKKQEEEEGLREEKLSKLMKRKAWDLIASYKNQKEGRKKIWWSRGGEMVDKIRCWPR